MRPWRATTILLLASVVLTGAFLPGLSEVYRACFRKSAWLPAKIQIEAALKLHPRDAAMQLGYAMIAWGRRDAAQLKAPGTTFHESFGFEPEVDWDPAPAFEKATALAPNDPAPKFHYAAFLLYESQTIPDLTRQRSPLRPPPPTREAKTKLSRANKLLTAVAAQDPGNAAVHYLLANAWFDDGEDGRAFQEISQAERCTDCCFYQREAQESALVLLRAARADQLRVPRLALGQSGKTFALLRDLARQIAARAEAQRQSGRVSQALKLSRSVLVLARTVRLAARDGLELVVAKNMPSVAMRPFVPTQVRQHLSKASDPYEWARQLHQAEARAFADYATSNGDPQVAEMALAEVRQASDEVSRWHAAASRLLEGRLVTRAGDWSLSAIRLLPYQALGLAIGLTLSGLMLLVMRLVRRTLSPTPMLPLLWVDLLVGLLCVLGALTTWARTLPSDAPQDMQGLYWVAPRALALFSGILWWLIVGGWSHRQVKALRRAEPERRLSREATAAVVAVPTIAALLLSSVLLLLAVYAALAADSHAALAMIRLGELHYLGIR